MKANHRPVDKATLRHKVPINSKHIFLGAKTLPEKGNKTTVLVPSTYVTTTKGLNSGKLLKSMLCSSYKKPKAKT